MSTQRPIPAVLYERPGCGLCEEMLGVLEGLRPEFPLDIQRVDINASPDLEARFGAEIPVLFLAGRKAFKYRVAASQLRERLRRVAAPRD